MRTRTARQSHKDSESIKVQTQQHLNTAGPVPGPGITRRLLDLQRTHGNLFVQRFLSRSGALGADAETGPALETAIRRERANGQALEPAVRSRFEPVFGITFGGVRIHTDHVADTLNRTLSARAFAVGHDLFFRQGEYNPDTAEGQELLAHELTHVAQQAETPKAKLAISEPGDRCEQEADAIARSVMQVLAESPTGEAPGDLSRLDGGLQNSARRTDHPRGEQGVQPHLTVKSFSREPALKDASTSVLPMSPWQPDKSFGEGSEMQDQNASVTTFAATANGVRIEVEATGVYTSATYPDGFKWTQTIDTNVPKGGTSSPYVDPRPNDDTKPFYYTDAEQVAYPTTFRDSPSRPAPASGATTWEAILGLNGVDESTKTVTGFDYLTYGFSIDSTGSVTLRAPSAGAGANHRSTLSSEFPAWTFA